MDAQNVLDIFKEITRIPRESGHEGPMTAFLQDLPRPAAWSAAPTRPATS